MTPFHDLEPLIDDLANVAQILITIFEGLPRDARNKQVIYPMTNHEHTMLAHLVYDLGARTSTLRADFYVAVDEEGAP